MSVIKTHHTEFLNSAASKHFFSFSFRVETRLKWFRVMITEQINSSFTLRRTVEACVWLLRVFACVCVCRQSNWRQVNNWWIKAPPCVWIGWAWRNEVKCDYLLITHINTPAVCLGLSAVELHYDWFLLIPMSDCQTVTRQHNNKQFLRTPSVGIASPLRGH